MEQCRSASGRLSLQGPPGSSDRNPSAHYSSSADALCLQCLNRARVDHVAQVLEEQKGALSVLDAEVVRSLREHELLAEDVGRAFERRLTVGERVADRVAELGGSWRFILGFAVVLAVWITANTAAQGRAFDPYPFILLNLVLSCLAAVQAPIIMMSQNRQEARDRFRAEHDDRVNLKAELEIRQMHWKLDELLNHQWAGLLEVQQIQIDLMEELIHKPRRVERPQTGEGAVPPAVGGGASGPR